MTTLQLVLICVGGAAILAATAAVKLMLIRRRRNAKANISSAESVDDEQSRQI